MAPATAPSRAGTDPAHAMGRLCELRAERWLVPVVAALTLFGCDEPGVARSGGGTTLAVEADSDFEGPRLADFELTECSGRTVTRADLAGRPFVLDFIFTTCAGPCPRMSASMEVLQDELAGSDVRLVSVTVDPATDTPAVLAEYAERYGADPERWWFLTGEAEVLYGLARSVHLAAAPDPKAARGFQVSHSTKLLVVDGGGVVRGYYDGDSEAGRLGAIARARHLAGR